MVTSMALPMVAVMDPVMDPATDLVMDPAMRAAPLRRLSPIAGLNIIIGPNFT